MRIRCRSNSFYSLFFLLGLVAFFLLGASSLAFQSDEILVDDEEFEGVQSPDPEYAAPIPATPPSRPTQTNRKRPSDADSDSKVHFSLEHAFGNSNFSPAGTFSARLKTWSHGGQTLTKLRFSRNPFTEAEQKNFKKLLDADDFYTIRIPSNVLNSPGKDFIISSVKARCLPRDDLQEHFVIHMEGVNILAVNYGSPGACPYPRPSKLPTKWFFKSHTVLKSSEQAPRTPAFSEETSEGENGEGEGVKPPERSFWAKYWMYLIPLGLIIMNAITQAANMPEEQQAGQASQPQPAGAIQRGQSTVVRRR